jgi:chromosome segregation ATPase
VSASPSTVDLSPAASAVAIDDAAERVWWNDPVLAALARLEQKMADGFAELKQAVADVAAEGGEISGTQQAVLAAIAALQARVTAVQATVDSVNAKLTAAGEEASAEAVQLQEHKAALDDMQQALNDAAAAANPPAEPTPEPTPAP